MSRRIQLIVVALLMQLMPAALAAPVPLADIARTQSATFTPSAQKLLRIWLIDIGQGDSILIELPPAMSQAMGNASGDPVDILVDGGGKPKSDADRAKIFLHERYPQGPTIEFMILTHHDQDHIAGLTEVLRDPAIAVKRVYFNGLAAFRKNIPPLVPKNPGSAFIMSGKRVLGRFDTDKILEPPYILVSLQALGDAFRGLPASNPKPQLITEFEAFAGAAVGKPVETFRRARFGDTSSERLDVRLSRNATASVPALKFQTLWPTESLLRYAGDWGKTTNGNSVVFRLDYGQFSMLFTGDLNEESGPGFVSHLASHQLEGTLDVDVLKAPHHGSQHNADEFIKHPRLKPVVTVASMGSDGFRLTGHKHPRDSTIELLGGFERFFSTFIHEREFHWSTLKASELNGFIEDTHVLVETDGTRFRVVEIARGSVTPDPVGAVDPGDGTLWIAAQ